jgi:hypothetical protein
MLYTTWHSCNIELNRCINGEDIVKFIKAQKIRWLEHVKRMDVGAMPRKKKKRKTPSEMDGRCSNDLTVMKIKQWTEKTKDSKQWRLVVVEAKAVAPRGWMD